MDEIERKRVVRVKVCGLMEPQHAETAARLGADMLGLVFAPSKRRIGLDQARRIIAALSPAGPALVGVFVNQPLDEVNVIAESCRLDYIQLSGDETPDYCRALLRPFIKALRMAVHDKVEDVAVKMESYRGIDAEAIFLLDTHVPGVYGGSGQTWDWGRAAILAARYPVLIAGGLDPENVSEAIRAVEPWGVDVSSGVESGGFKDVTRIAAFIEAVKS